jgi:type II secretory pathway component PulF
MYDTAGLEVILTHFFNRIKENMPLTPGPEEEALFKVSSLGRNPLYQKTKKELQKGKSLSDALSSVRGLPPFFLKVIKRGEASGNLAKALKIVLEHYPVFARLKFHMYTVYAYVSVTLVFLLAFIVFFSFMFCETYSIALTHTMPEVPTLFRLLFLISNPYFIVFFTLAVIAGFAIVRYGLRTDVSGLIIRHTPVIKQNYSRILSLEIGTMYHYNLELGLPPQQALAEAVKGLGKGEISHSLKRTLAMIEEGQSLRGALASESALAGIPAIDVIALGEATGKAQELVEELIEFLHKYLSANLDKEMQNLFRWCVVACGVFVGIGIVYVFSAIIYSYSFIIY